MAIVHSQYSQFTGICQITWFHNYTHTTVNIVNWPTKSEAERSVACMQLLILFVAVAVALFVCICTSGTDIVPECVCMCVWINITPNLMRLSAHYIREYYTPNNNQQRRNNKNQQTRTDEGKANIHTTNSLVCHKYALFVWKKTFGWKWDGRARDKTKQKINKCKQTIVITWIYKILFECNI